MAMFNKNRVILLILIVLVVVGGIYISKHQLSAMQPFKKIAMNNLSQVTIAPENIPTDLINQMYEAREQNISSLSLRLMTAAQWGNQLQYDTVKQEMLKSLQLEDRAYSDEEIDHINERIDARQAWMLGRMIVSAMYMGDNATANNVAAIASAYLHDPAIQGAPSAFSVWANGYLLEYYARVTPQEYEKNVEPMFNGANAVIAHFKTQQNDAKQSEDALSTIVWIDVVNLYASAVAKDKIHYDAIKASMLADTNSQSITQALEKIPETDFPTWAYYWTMRAAKESEDINLMTEMKEYAAKNDILNNLKNQLTDVSAQYAKDPQNTILKALQESLRNDYVLGVTNQLFVEYID